ncbi:MAG: hypothetical protein ABEH89_00305 [bacterium]
MPETIIAFVNWLSAPVPITTFSIILFFVVMYFYRTITKPKVDLGIFAVVLGIFGAFCMEPWFYKQVTKPRHVPAVAIIFLMGFFGWLAMRQAAINDEYIEQGMEIPERAEAEKEVLTWPDLVFTEFISTLFVSVILMVWALTLSAPLEEPASATTSPNPAKAPWYFLGLQELLVYFDPWIAGVIIPTLIIVGLMAIPYIDRNPKGSGYYTYTQRPFAVTTYMFGWYILWILLVFRGTFLRGPNWAHFGLFEKWDTAKATASVNITFSDIIWVDILNMTPPEISGTNVFGLFTIPSDIWLGIMTLPIDPFVREFPGFIVLGLYFIVPTIVLAKTWWRDLYIKLGLIRYSILSFLMLTFVAIPLKMYLRWIFSLKYIVEIQSLYLNI